MAEIAVKLLIDQLGQLLVQEVKLLSGVHKKIEDIKIELESIRYFLKDAEAKAAAQELQGNSSDGVEHWVSQVRDVAYSIEDVIDEYTFIVARLPHGRGLVGVLQTIRCSIKKLKLRRNIANDIRKVKLSLKDIVERKNRYNLNFIDDRSSSAMRRDNHIASYYVEPDQVVGHESTRKELYDLLTNKSPQRRVIALVGAGGLGKTTLAANVYKNDDVKSQFNCHAWIVVGKTCTKENLLRNMIRKFYDSREESPPKDIETMDAIGLIEVLRRYLKEKGYMIVFDDVCDVEFWKDVEHALLDNNKSSRIIITARNEDVVGFIPTSIIHISFIQPLPSNKARELFCKKAFAPDGSCPEELEELSHEILEKCGGLPLAIAAIGGLLSKENKSVSEWKRLRNNLGSKLIDDPQLRGCNRVLYESYNDLPHHLKACLLYFGLFPEDYSISVGKLCRLWIAEGFVQQTDEIPLEQVAKAYLTELIQRCLIQVSEIYLNGGIKRCQVHDLMHEIILRKTKKLGFSRVLYEQGHTSQQKTTRRIAICTSNDNVLESIANSKVRSVFVFDGSEQPNYFMRKLVANFKLMKVLVFEDAPLLDHVPEEVGNLFHLHYLSLKKTHVRTLPKSIGKLLNLESLDLRETFVTELPHEIKYLKKLRCLLIYNFDSIIGNFGSGIKLPEGFGRSADMQKLSYVLSNSKVLKELKNLRQMRRLGINLGEGTGEDLCDCIANMENLKVLYLQLRNREMTLDVQSITSFPQYLEYLVVVGNLKKLPNWIPNLQNLYSICLKDCPLTDDPIRVLHSLPNLLELSLCHSLIEEQLHIKDGWFSKLQELYLIDLARLKSIMIEDGAMPALRKLWIRQCRLMTEIPKGIKYLRNLKILRFLSMSKEVASDVKTHDNLEQLKHVQNVRVHIAGERSYTYMQAGSAGCQNIEVEDFLVVGPTPRGRLRHLKLVQDVHPKIRALLGLPPFADLSVTFTELART